MDEIGWAEIGCTLCPKYTLPGSEVALAGLVELCRQSGGEPRLSGAAELFHVP